MDSWEMLRQVSGDWTQELLQMSMVGIQSENVGRGGSLKRLRDLWITLIFIASSIVD